VYPRRVISSRVAFFSMALMALRMMQESAKHPAPLKYPKKVYSVFDDPDVTKPSFRFSVSF
jgi:hypothetical protein